MDKKITIKELASELNIDHSTMMREIKHLNINVKSSKSTVTDDEALSIRKHYKSESTVTSSVPSEDGAVILRRRRVVDAPDGSEEEKAVSKSAEKASPAKKETKDVAEKKTSEKKVSDKAETAPETKKSEPKAAKPQQAKAEEKVAKEKTAETTEASKEPKLAKQKKSKPATPAARIIQPAKKVEPVVEPKSEVVKEVPVEVVTEAPKAEKPSQEKVQKETVAASDKEVSKPSESKHKNDKKSTATMSAQPDGTSTKSILPPAGERSFAQRVEATPHEPRSQVRVISKPAPQPPRDPNAPKPQDSRPSRDGRDNRENRGGGRFNNNRGDRPDNRSGDRPQGQRPQGQRPQGQGQGQRPQGQRDFQPRDNKDGDQQRPARPMTPRPPRPVDGVPFPTEEQSRKKRNKNKKANEFSETAPQPDFKFNKYSFGMEDDDAPRRRRKPKKKDSRTQVNTTAPMKAAKRKIRIEETIRLSDMAHQMGLKSSEIIKVLFGLGVMATINSSLDFDTASVVASEFEYEVEKVGFSAEEAILPTTPDTPEQLKPRPPVVTIMGHVDHGKTSLLDAIRETNVTAGEAGGITQHIGAYHVRTKRGVIAFLDTPGHEAFTAMRLRGAQVTDIVVLVVAADDGVMEQTREAINHARAAEVPIIVAVNKMDKEGANPDRVLRELAELGLQAEDWGGDTVVSMLSAKKREGIDELLELIILQSELMELKANPDKPARGHIVEAKLDKGRGPVATVLIQEGTLNQGDAFVCGVFAGRVRALFNDQGKKIMSAGPSVPVEVQGFEGVPEAGEEFVSLQDEKVARRIAETRAIKQREKILAKESRVTLETFLSRKPDSAEAMKLNLILKADVQGSLEAITEALNKLSTEKVRISVIHGGAGSISESDIMLAAASEAIIIGFNVRPTAKVKEVADSENVDIRFYDIIYKLVEEIRAAMAGLLAPVQKEVYLGQAEVRDTFTLSRVGTIAGTYVVDGKMARNAGVRLLRDGIVIYTGKISSLKRFKDDAKEVAKGFECGISLENYNDIKVGDIMETFEMKEEAAEL